MQTFECGDSIWRTPYKFPQSQPCQHQRVELMIHHIVKYNTIHIDKDAYIGVVKTFTRKVS